MSAVDFSLQSLVRICKQMTCLADETAKSICGRPPTGIDEDKVGFFARSSPPRKILHGLQEKDQNRRWESLDHLYSRASGVHCSLDALSLCDQFVLYAGCVADNRVRQYERTMSSPTKAFRH